MRLFLAIDLPTNVKKQLNEQIKSIKHEYPQFNWAPYKNFHITVYFFGEIEDYKPIEKRLEEVVFDQKAFYLYSFSLGLFLNHKIVIYLDFRREKTIEIIARRIKEIFNKPHNGLKFIPHLSLARYKIPSKQQYLVLKKRLERLPVDISFKVKKLVLFESILKGKLPQYKKLKEVSLL